MCITAKSYDYVKTSLGAGMARAALHHELGKPCSDNWVSILDPLHPACMQLYTNLEAEDFEW